MQNFSDQFANHWFVIDDQAAPLHVILRILTIARPPGLSSPGGLQPRGCESGQIETGK